MVKDFLRLLGTWKITGKFISGSEFLPIIGTDSYELILDGKFILHKADVKMGDETSETFEIIDLGSSPVASMHYFNSKGEKGIMHGSIVNNEFKIKSDELKFAGTISESNSEITGKWFRRDGEKWEHFIDLKLDKPAK